MIVDPEAMRLREIISTFSLLLLLIQEGLYQLQAKGMWLKYWLTPKSNLTRKSVIKLTDYPDMTVAGA